MISIIGVGDSGGWRLILPKNYPSRLAGSPALNRGEDLGIVTINAKLVKTG